MVESLISVKEARQVNQCDLSGVGLRGITLGVLCLFLPLLFLCGKGLVPGRAQAFVLLVF